MYLIFTREHSDEMFLVHPTSIVKASIPLSVELYPYGNARDVAGLETCPGSLARRIVQ